MPILRFEETIRRGLYLPEEEIKPVICVFDPIAVHAPILDYALAEIRKEVNVFWQASFSPVWIEAGGIDEWIDGDLIAVKRPILLISELQVVSGSYLFGLKMLKSLRRAAGLRNLPLVVISDADCLLEVYDKAEKELKELRVSQFFNWQDLEKESEEQKRLFDFVSQIIGFRM